MRNIKKSKKGDSDYIMSIVILLVLIVIFTTFLGESIFTSSSDVNSLKRIDVEGDGLLSWGEKIKFVFSLATFNLSEDKTTWWLSMIFDTCLVSIILLSLANYIRGNR